MKVNLLNNSHINR